VVCRSCAEEVETWWRYALTDLGLYSIMRHGFGVLTTTEGTMDAILTRCGYRWDLCLAYAPNVTRNPADREKLSDGWFKYYGFRIPPERILCDGCMAQDPRLIDKACPVRPCVIERGLENCAPCDEYVCDRVAQRLVTYEWVKERVGDTIPEDDYLCFIRPYENERRLEALRTAKSQQHPVERDSKGEGR
jgi:hypothetical protein